MTILEQYKLLNRGQVRFLSSSKKWILLALAILGILIGWYFTETLLKAPKSVATINLGDRSLEGQNAIELSFWLALFFGNILSFRTMEVFFRSGFARFVRDLPLKAEAVFLNRFRQSIFEALSLALMGTALFVPLSVKAPLVGLASILNLVLGLLVAVPLSIAAFLYLASALSGDQKVLKDAYGGSGSAFIYGPILGFALVAATCLAVKLGSGELLFRGGVSNAFLFIIIIVLLIAAFSFKFAWSSFGKHYYNLLARFNEADSTVFDLGNLYQTSDYPGKSKLASYKYPIGAIARSFQLQYHRRFPIQRSVEKLSIIAIGIFFFTRKADSIPLWAVALTGTLVFGLLSNPWHRIARLSGHLDFVSPQFIGQGKTKLASIEILPFALFSALLPGVVLLVKHGMDLSVLYASLTAMSAILIIINLIHLQFWTPTYTRVIPPITLLSTLALVAFLGPLVTFVLSIFIVVLLLLWGFQKATQAKSKPVERSV